MKRGVKPAYAAGDCGFVMRIGILIRSWFQNEAYGQQGKGFFDQLLQLWLVPQSGDKIKDAPCTTGIHQGQMSCLFSILYLFFFPPGLSPPPGKVVAAD